VDAGHVDAEAGDGVDPDRTDDGLQSRCHRIEGTTDPVVVEGIGLDTEDLGHRPHSRAQSSTLHRGRGWGDVSRLATNASMTWP